MPRGAETRSEPAKRIPSDDWRPGAGFEVLRLRARLLAAVRAFFARRGILEVETPSLSAAATPAPHLASFRLKTPDSVASTGPGLYLHTSPEFAMKRLLAAGSPDIYQICRVYRQGETGTRHNPEFTLIEWYRRSLGYEQLMDEVADLVVGLDPDAPVVKQRETLSYTELFQRHLEVDPLRASLDELAACARHSGLHLAGQKRLVNRDDWLDLLLSHCIEPRLPRDRLIFVCEYPTSQAALARLCPHDPRLAERFELYLNGVELANGFRELSDAGEQRRRFAAELAQRRACGLPAVPLDERFLRALEHGLPECSGVALGFDRLVMLAAGKQSLDEVMAFSTARA